MAAGFAGIVRAVGCGNVLPFGPISGWPGVTAVGVAEPGWGTAACRLATVGGRATDNAAAATPAPTTAPTTAARPMPDEGGAVALVAFALGGTMTGARTAAAAGVTPAIPGLTRLTVVFVTLVVLMIV